MPFRVAAFMAALLMLPASAKCQHPIADATLPGLYGEAPGTTLYPSPLWRPLHRMSAASPSLPTLAIRISSDSTTGIPVIMGGLLGGITLAGVVQAVGVYDDGTEDPWTAALVYGAGVGGGAAFGALLGSREPRLLPTVAVAMAASVPLAFVFIDQRGVEPSGGDVPPQMVGVLLPIIAAWFTNKVLQ